MYLGISPTVTNWSGGNDEFSLLFDQNPLSEFVELPENYSNLKYCNLMCGIIRGACEMVGFPLHFNMFSFEHLNRYTFFIIQLQVQLEVSSWFVQDTLKGDPTTELRVKFIKKLEDALPAGED